MHPFKPTFNFTACRVKAIEVTEWADDTHVVVVTATNVRPPHRESRHEFVVNSDGSRLSKRFDAFLRAIGIRGISEPDDFVGRYFAFKDGGKSPDDFACLEYAAACLESDRDAHLRSLAYAAECAVEERLDLVA